MLRLLLCIASTFMLILSLVIGLMNIIGGVLPYMGEIRYFGQSNSLYIPYTMDASRGLSYLMRPPLHLFQVDWAQTAPYLITWIDDKTYITDAEGGELRQLTADRVYPIWSPDGTYLAFNILVDGGFYLANGDGTALELLTPIDRESHTLPSFSPDSTRIAYVRDRDIYVMNLADRSTTRITNTPTRLESLPHWSPDGQRLNFYWRDPALNSFFAGVVNADGQNYIELPYPVRITLMPVVWSHDSTQFSFFTQIEYENTNEQRLVIVPLDGSEPRMLDITFPSLFFGAISWLGDNRTLTVSWGNLRLGGAPCDAYEDHIDSVTGTLLQRQMMPYDMRVVPSPDGDLGAAYSADRICITELLTDAEARCFAAQRPITRLHWLP